MLAYRTIRRIVIATAGATVICVGIALLVLPGPGLVTIAVGLGVLGLEFAWARHWLRQMKETGGTVVDVIRNNVTGNGKAANGADGTKNREESPATEDSSPVDNADQPAEQPQQDRSGCGEISERQQSASGAEKPAEGVDISAAGGRSGTPKQTPRTQQSLKDVPVR